MRTLLAVFLLSTASMFAAELPSTATATTAINALGVDLLHRAARPQVNFLISPYSIQSALAMTYAGAEGKTREEMAKVLHFPANDAVLNDSFAALQEDLRDLMHRSIQRADDGKQYGVTNDPVLLTVANRLFGQAGYDFRAPFLAVLKDRYQAPFEPVDFIRDAPGVTKQINAWVEAQTQQRIRDLVPNGALNELTRLALVNAVYLKAPWEKPFSPESSRPGPFHVAGGKSVDVPMMNSREELFYAKENGFSAVAIPYGGRELQFLILLPDQPDGLAALESKLNAELFVRMAQLQKQELILSLPKFKLEPSLFQLGKELQSLGMKSAFNQPEGSANFDRIAPRRPNDYLYISDVFHKTFLNLDEKGTEAAAATAVTFMTKGIHEPTKPIEVKVDRPFFFAIQHRRSGACLFLGHVSDPR